MGEKLLPESVIDEIVEEKYKKMKKEEEDGQ
jgi:DNA recombination-dependent growth factor C